MNNPYPLSTLYLSQEEVLYLLRQFNLDHSFPGLGNIQQEISDVVLLATSRALLARQILVVSETGEFRIDQGVQAALSVCMYPTQVLALASSTRENAQQQYFYRVPELVVKHTFDALGIHSFTITQDFDAEQIGLPNLLTNLPVNTPKDFVYTLPLSDWKQVQSYIANSEHTEVKDKLGITEWLQALRSTFITTLREPVLKLSLQHLSEQTTTIQQTLLTLWVHPKAIWLVTENSSESPQITLQCLSDSATRRIVLNLVREFCGE